jgi:hypothetical protein
MIPLSSKQVDRPMVRMIAYKRLATGLVSMVAFVVALLLYLTRKPTMTLETWGLFAVFFAVTMVGGAWTFRDGLRTLRLLGNPPDKSHAERS